MERRLTTRWQFLCGSAFFATGAGLLAYIASGISLIWTALAACAVGAIAVSSTMRRLDASRQRELRRRIAVGVVAGLIATVAYDLSRFGLISLTGIRFWPFDVFRVFGQALFGDTFSDSLTRVGGLLYHLANGVGFGVAYVVWMGERGPAAGLAFAMFLELCMVTVYPGWLNLKALDEFLQVSVFGHIVYGATLGWSARRVLARLDGDSRTD
jgi:hypothetical protein